MSSSIPDDATVHPPSARGSRGFLGCGLSGTALVAVGTISIAIFLFWGGPLWSAPPGASHMGRILVSYLAVLPLTALALAAGRRWSWVHLASSVALVWAAKLVVTSSLYSYFTTGSAQSYSPAPVTEPAAQKTRPLVAPAAIGTAALSGIVRDRGVPAAGVVVVARVPGPIPAGQRIAVNVHAAHYDRSIYLATVRDTLAVTNQDGSLHNLRARREHRTSWNLPVPAGGEPRQSPALEAGVYELGCDEHPAEHAVLIVVDHPHAAVTDGAGRFVLRELPAGAVTLDLYRDRITPRTQTVQAPAEVALDLGER